MNHILGLSLACMLSSTALADDQDDRDIDAARSAATQQQSVREVIRGFYVKSNVGGLFFVGPLAQQGLLDPGTSLALTVGQDFLDREKTSAAWEVFFHQGLNNGASYFSPNMTNAAPEQRIQGDIHSFTLGAAVEYSTYVSRRLGIGARAGGGVAFIPLLMNEQFYQTEVVAGAWRNEPSRVHDGPLPVIVAGPTIEYYTKLSHFSIGVDANFAVYLGLDYAVDATAFMKYTF